MDLRRVGRSIRALRIRRGWRQSDLARESELSRSVVGRVERGGRTGLTLDAVAAIARALGANVELVIRWDGEGLDRLMDEGHATLVDRAVAWLRAHGWEVAVEVSFARGGERGAIDILAWHPIRRALAVFEVKSVTPDMQAMLFGLDRKTRLGPEIGRARGWDARSAAHPGALGHADQPAADRTPCGVGAGGAAVWDPWGARVASGPRWHAARGHLVRDRCPRDGRYGGAPTSRPCSSRVRGPAPPAIGPGHSQ